MRSKPKNASRFAKRIFLCFSHLRLRRRFHVSAGRYRQQRGNTSCEAANRRNEKKALSAATSFFPFRQPLRGLKGASSPFLVGPARRNRWCFSGSLLTSKENISLNERALWPARSASRLTKRKNLPRATSARTSSKKKPALPLARAERKPLDQKRKHPPRHRRANLLKEELALMQSKLPQRYSFTAKINFQPQRMQKIDAESTFPTVKI